MLETSRRKAKVCRQKFLHSGGDGWNHGHFLYGGLQPSTAGCQLRRHRPYHPKSPAPAPLLAARLFRPGSDVGRSSPARRAAGP